MAALLKRDKPEGTFQQTQQPPHLHHHHLEPIDNRGVKVVACL